MPLTSGNVTIKLSAGTYSSWAAFWDDLGNLTGDITCTVDASAFTEGSAPAAVQENLNGYTLHVLPVAFPSTTDASTGARFTCNHTGTILVMRMEGAGEVIVEGMVFIEGTSTPSRGFDYSFIDTNFDYIIRRNIIKGAANPLRFGDDTLTGLKVYNNIFFGGATIGLTVDKTGAGIVFSNNTFVNFGSDNLDCGSADVFTIENTLSYGGGNTDFLSLAYVTGNNNAGSDATGADANWGTTTGSGSNNLINIADPFNNLAADDFTITAEGVIGTAGKDLSGDFTDDFFGVTRSNWTIGACEFIPPTPQAVGGTLTPIGALAKVATFPRTYGGSLTPTGALEAALTAYRGFGGDLTPTGALARIRIAYKALSGSMTPSGALAVAIIMEQALSGELDLSGTLRGINPAWLVLDDILTWQGEWSITWSYDLNDVVLYKFGDEWHVFVSKISHNVGNIPTSTAEAWHRLYQEQYL